jgi:VanZ family protein
VKRRAITIVWTITLAYWAFSFIMTHKPPGPTPLVPVSDKVAHAVTYAIIAGLLSAALGLRGMAPRRVLLIAVTACLAYGVFDELSQIPVGRTAEVNDWLADAVGTLFGAGVVFAARLISH